MLDDLLELGIKKNDAESFIKILSQIKFGIQEEYDLECLSEDVFAFEGGGPSTRELLLLLVK